MVHNEFELIQQFFSNMQFRTTKPFLGIGDDAAILEPFPHNHWVISVDTSVAGIHFPPDTDPEDIGHKTLAVSLSDLAAMGATPHNTLLSLTMPNADEQWLQQFSRGYHNLSAQYQVSLIGGDTTRGPLTISTIALGLLPSGKALKRVGAAIGDTVYVTGTLGDANFALSRWLNGQKASTPCELLQRLTRPTPRIEIGQALLEIATSAIDISDGLAADLPHILTASQVGACIDATKLPLSSTLLAHCPKTEAIERALTGGDDYELCFTAPKEANELISTISARYQCPITAIGTITNDANLLILDAHGNSMNLSKSGYLHF